MRGGGELVSGQENSPVLSEQEGDTPATDSDDTDSTPPAPPVAPSAPPVVDPPAPPAPPATPSVSDCERFEALNHRKVVISETGASESLKFVDENIWLKVVGNKAQLDVIFERGQKPIHVCLDVSGNDSQVQVDVFADVTGFSIKSTGNEAQLQVDVKELSSASFDRVVLRGNKPQVQIGGSGSFNCPIPDVGGNDPSFQCSR